MTVPNIASVPSAWPDLVKTIASVAALPLAGFTFWLGYRQKDRERVLSYYHKAVVDVVLPQILAEFASETERLEQAARDALDGVKSERKTMPRSCSLALSDFAQDLFKLQDAIVERTIIFDESVTDEIRHKLESTQDAVTNWFGDVSLHKRREFEEIKQILQAKQRGIINILYRGEFRDFAKKDSNWDRAD